MQKLVPIEIANTYFKREGVDETAKKYWRDVLKSMHGDTKVVARAMDDLQVIMDGEDKRGPADNRKAYQALGSKYEDQGGLSFVRIIRSEMLRERWKAQGIASAVVPRTGGLKAHHSLGKVALLLYASKAEFEKARPELEKLGADIMVPETFETK